MLFKPGAATGKIEPELWYAAGIWDAASREIAHQPAVITSGTDGTHCPHSLHSVGRAIDLRTSNMTTTQRATVEAAVRAIVEPLGYHLLTEPDHTHLSYPPEPNCPPWLDAARD